MARVLKGSLKYLKKGAHINAYFDFNLRNNKHAIDRTWQNRAEIRSLIVLIKICRDS